MGRFEYFEFRLSFLLGSIISSAMDENIYGALTDRSLVGACVRCSVPRDVSSMVYYPYLNPLAL